MHCTTNSLPRYDNNKTSGVSPNKKIPLDIDDLH